MYNCCIEILAQTASFRNPDFQNFHKTLPLPPPTTIIGLAGAAMGLSAKMAQDFFDETAFKIGVFGEHNGTTKDTWKYNRRTKNMHLYDPLLDGSVIQKELMIDNRFLIAFCCQEKEKIKVLIEAFENPTFALTMGNSDSLAKIKKITTDLTFVKSKTINHCIMASDVVAEVVNKAAENLEFSIYHSSEPTTYDLPIRYLYSSDYGQRIIGQTAVFSLIQQEMLLNYEVEGILHQQTFIPIFNL